MVNPTSCQFANYRSVRFNLDNFALPVVDTKKKNTIYTNYLSKLKGTKHQLLPMDEPLPNYGYDHVAQWNSYVFVSNNTGIYYGFVLPNGVDFQPLERAVFPKQIAVMYSRLFMLSQNQKRILYSVPLNTTLAEGSFLEETIHIPPNYGLGLDLGYYRGKLLVICENGLLTINRNFVLEHLSDDSEMMKANMVADERCYWESDWFSLGYATNTQTLREIFLKTNVGLTLTVTSNRTQRSMPVQPSDRVQKIKINLNGDQFKVSLSISDPTQVLVSDFAAVVAYGKRG